MRSSPSAPRRTRAAGCCGTTSLPPDHAEILANIERARQSWADGTWAVFVITVDGEAVGGANLGFYEHDIAECSYFLAGAERGKGYATGGAPSRALGLRAERYRAARAARQPAERGFDPARRARRLHARGNPARITSGNRRIAFRHGGVLAAAGASFRRVWRKMGGAAGTRRAARGACPRTRPYSRYDRVLRPWPRTTRRAPTTRNIPPNPPSRASGS